MRLLAFCKYTARSDGERSQGGWNAFKLVRAAKGEPFKGYAKVRFPHVGRVRLTTDNASKVFDFLAPFFASFVREMNLVPLPGRHTVSISDKSSRALRFARAIAAVENTSYVWDCLRFREPVPSARATGDNSYRSPEFLFPRLEFHSSQPPNPNAGVVLVDDIVSTGGHMQAARARLIEDAQFGGPVHAVAVARTQLEEHAEPMKPFADTLDDWSPSAPPPWMTTIPHPADR